MDFNAGVEIEVFLRISKPCLQFQLRYARFGRGGGGGGGPRISSPKVGEV